MGILIPILFIVATATMGISLWNNAATSSVATVADAWKGKSVVAGERFRTDLFINEGTKVDSSTLEVTFKNSGGLPLGQFDDWDIWVQYSGADGIAYNKRVPRSSTAGQANTWYLTGIYNVATSESEVFNPNVLDPNEEMRIQLTVSPALAGGTFSYVTLGTPNGVVPATATVTILGAAYYYLQNNPTPPTGNTNMQHPLPLKASLPTASTLYNYDQDQDAIAGRRIDKGGSGVNETDANQYQNWRTSTLTSALTLPASVTLDIWAALSDFNNIKRGNIQVFLRDYDGASSYTEIANAQVNAFPWGGVLDVILNNWVKKTLTFSIPGGYTVPVGHQLEVKIIVLSNTFTDSMVFAYDTTSYQSFLNLEG